MNSTGTWKLCRLPIWREKSQNSLVTRVWTVEKQKTTTCHFGMRGVYVEYFELCREHFLGNPVAVSYITHSQHAGRSEGLEHDHSCTRHTVLLGSMRRKDIGGPMADLDRRKL